MHPRPIIVALAAVESAVVFVAVMFLVAWLLEDAVYFSLFVGIPAGLIAGALAFWAQVSLSRRRN